MNYFVIALLAALVATVGCSRNPVSIAENSPTMQLSDYGKKLMATKAKYPFSRWQRSGLEQYTASACGRFTAIFDTLIGKLISMGKEASETSKRAIFREAVEALNRLHEEATNLIETEERHELCELLGHIAIAAGMDPGYGGSGEGPASGRAW